MDLKGIVCQTYFSKYEGFSGAPGKTRTCDLLIRSQTLYPTELRAHSADSILYRRRNFSATPNLPTVPEMASQ
jgi:hypothetical protein